MMLQSGQYGYYESEQFQAVSLPYGERRISMYVFLPKSTASIREFQKDLTADNWQNWMKGFSEREGDIVLPRFKVEYGAELLPILTTLGGPEFAGEDFRGMGAGPLIISNVIHKTFVEVNEEGTEAAAATAVGMPKSAPMFRRFRMVIDRPFFCAIRDNKTGALLFMGFVMQPS
jgi:serpin B